MARDDERNDGPETRTIVRIVVAVVLAALLIAFVLANTESVEIDFVFTDRSVPLIWVLVVTALVGAVLDRLVIWLRARRRR